MATKSSCTRSLGASHPTCHGLAAAGLHGFTGGTLTDGVSHGALGSLVTEVAGYAATTALAEPIVQGARPEDMLANGRGSAARRMNLTPCENVSVPERLDITR